MVSFGNASQRDVRYCHYSFRILHAQEVAPQPGGPEVLRDEGVEVK